MTVMNKNLYLLIFIIFTSVFFRFYLWGKVPPGLHFDEASFGYNAWSILKTGRDEFGNFLPLNFRSFDDYRPPVYIYLTSASIALFGPNDFSLRFPSFIAGLGLIILIYFFAKDLFGKKIAVWSVLLAGLNPTLILMSRTAYDANLALMLSVLTFWLFYRGLMKKNLYYCISAIICACLAMLSYQSSKIVVPVILLSMIFIWLEQTKKIISNSKNAIILGIIVLVFGVPTLSAFFYKGSLFRFSSLSVFDNPDTVKIAADRQAAGFANIFVNRRLIGLENGVSHYLDNFHPTYLFSPTVFSTQFQTPNDNYFHLFDLLLFILGIVTIFSKLDRKKKLFLLFWFLLVPLPTTFVAAAPKITRVLPLIPVIIFVSAFGWEKLWNKSKWLVIIPYGLTTILFFYSFFGLFNFENAKYWQTGYREMVNKALVSGANKIYVSNSLQLPYIYFLWYGKVDPLKYLAQGGTKTGNILAADNTFDNFVFHGLTEEIFTKATDRDLFIGYPDDFKDFGHIVDRVGCVAKQECIFFVKK